MSDLADLFGKLSTDEAKVNEQASAERITIKIQYQALPLRAALRRPP